MYDDRTYRSTVTTADLLSFPVVFKETDLFILCDRDLRKNALDYAIRFRESIDRYILAHPEFLTSLIPIDVSPDAPPIVLKMAAAGRAANVGPMAAVAGAMAEFLGNELLKECSEIIIENGGDIFVSTKKERVMRVFADNPLFDGRVNIRILPEDTPLGVCTSSGKIGPSLSFGKADAVTVLSRDTALADAAATAIANIVQTPDDVPAAVERAQEIAGVSGVVVIKDDKIGVWGGVRII